MFWLYGKGGSFHPHTLIFSPRQFKNETRCKYGEDCISIADEGGKEINIRKRTIFKNKEHFITGSAMKKTTGKALDVTSMFRSKAFYVGSIMITLKVASMSFHDLQSQAFFSIEL